MTLLLSLPWLGDHSRVAIWSWRSPWRPMPVYEVSFFRIHPCHVSCPWWDLTAYKYPGTVKANSATPANSEHKIYSTPMPKPNMPPVYPTGPSNLNDDGTSITYKTSHQGPNAAQWELADSEGMERLLTSRTLRPIMLVTPAGRYMGSTIATRNIFARHLDF